MLTQRRCSLQAEFEGEKFEKYGEWREAWGCMKIGDVRSLFQNPTPSPPSQRFHFPAERHLSVQSDAPQRVISNMCDTSTMIINIGYNMFVVIMGC